MPEHDIVENRRPLTYSPFHPPGPPVTFSIRQCKHCGMSEGFIEHLGRVECREAPGAAREEAGDG